MKRGRDFTESLQKMLKENKFEVGNKVIFFAEKEKQGVLEKDLEGNLFIRGADGNRRGLTSLFMDSDFYIKKV